MIPHICMVGHNPPDTYGDCLRACVASLCNVEDSSTVPHFLFDGDDEKSDGRLRDYLASIGYRPFISGFHGNTSLADIQSAMAGINSNVEYLLFCSSGGGDHVVVCCNDAVVHNPSWVRSPIDGPLSNGMWYVMVLVPICP